MSTLVAEFVKQAYKHPMFVLILAMVIIGWIGFSISHFAFASEVDELKREVNSISVTIKRSAMETRLQTLEMEIFGLERMVAEGRASDEHYNRLAKQRSALGEVKRALARID